ncbi:MAG: hypothetical protein AAB381_03450 [Patescibacteria group bacterium]
MKTIGKGRSSAHIQVKKASVKTKQRRPKWEAPLRRHLSGVRVPETLYWMKNFMLLRWITSEEKPALILQACDEIIVGIRFLIKRKKPVTSSLLSSSFHISSSCGCLFARAVPERDFDEALKIFELTYKEAAGFGCCHVVHTGNQKCLMDASWTTLYNRLWKKAGRFLRDHPELTKGIPSLQAA